jgi:UDP-glucose 4-epimerase
LIGNKMLVIGGAGYVGSHFTKYAMDAGCDVTVIDNLSKGHRSALRGSRFIFCDLLDQGKLETHLSSNRYDGVFHFAGSILVGESVTEPAMYYRNNLVGALNMLEALRNTGHNKIVFSSTCAIYGAPRSMPLREDHPTDPISPYGRTKLAIEWMLEDYNRAYGLKSACLRYFNAAGCEPESGLGEDHHPETHLIPNVVKYALGLKDDLIIYGNDYPTPDGTCVRDYIHVTDLAEAHLKALDKLDQSQIIKINLGTGKGFSNLEVLQAVSKISGKSLTPEIGPRRPGDSPELIADPTLAFSTLGWVPTRSDLDKIVGEALQWTAAHPNGYPPD